MADNSVYITGAADGAFATALDGLPPWATEATAVKIATILKDSQKTHLKALSEIVKSAKASGKGMSPESIKKVNDELDALNNTIGKANKQAEDNLNKDKKRAQAEEDGSKKKNLKETFASEALDKLKISSLGVFGVYKDYTEISDSLFQSGINVLNGNDSTTNSMQGLQQVVTLTGLRLQTLQKVMEKYSTTVNAIGVTKFAKAISMSNTQLTNLGYSSEAQAELVATMMESERGYSVIRNKSAQEIADDAVKLGAQLTSLSTTVGMNRQQLQENLKANSMNKDSTLVAAKWGEQAAKNVNVAASALGPGMGKALQQMAAASDPVFTQFYKDLQDAGMGDLANQFAQLAKESRTLDPTVTIQRFKELSDSIPAGKIVGLENQIAAGNQAASSSLEAIASLKQFASGVSEASTKQNDAALDTQRALSSLNTEIEKAQAIPQMMFAPMVEQIDLAANSLKTLNNAIISGAGAVSFETRSWIGFGLAIIGAIASISLLSGSVNTLSKLFSSASSSGGTISSGFSFLGSTIGRLGSLFVRFLGPIAALYAAFQFGVSIGETIYEALTGFESVNVVTKAIGDAFSGLLSWVVGNFKDTINQTSKFLTDIGSAITKIAPWLSSLVSWVSTFVSGVAGKFASKMTGGLIGSDVSGFVKNKDATASAPASPSKTPIPSAVGNSSGTMQSYEKEVQRIHDEGKVLIAPVIDKEKANDGINTVLEQQKILLQEMLDNFKSLVSVNKDILRYIKQQ